VSAGQNQLSTDSISSIFCANVVFILLPNNNPKLLFASEATATWRYTIFCIVFYYFYNANNARFDHFQHRVSY